MRLFKRKGIQSDVKKVKQKFLFYFMLMSGLYMFGYFIASVVFGLNVLYTFIPIAIALVYVISFFAIKDFKFFTMFITNPKRGRLMLYLNANSHFDIEHKLEMVKWVYLGWRRVRIEKTLELSEQVRKGIKLSKEDQKLLHYKSVKLPMQLTDGFNEAITINALIYAHRNIKILDKGVRDKLNLTDENINKFNLQTEINRCKK